MKLLLTSYFGRLGENSELAAELPVAGLHLGAVNRRDDIALLPDILPSDRVLSLGVINGRNIWKTDLNAVLDWLESLAECLGDRLWIAPSCSLLHVPVDLEREEKLDGEIKSWLALPGRSWKNFSSWLRPSIWGGMLSRLNWNQTGKLSKSGRTLPGSTILRYARPWRV